MSSATSTSASSTTSSAPVATPTVDQGSYLDTHNVARVQFGASELTWSDDLQSKAQSYANECQLKHSDGAFGAIGENLVAATGDFDAVSAVATFLQDESESRNYVCSYS